MTGFIELTETSGRKTFYNTEEIRKFYKEKEHTVLSLKYGVDLVRETPNQIMEAIKENYYVQHTA